MVNEIAIKQSFQKIKQEMEELKTQNKYLYEELFRLKKELQEKESAKDLMQEILTKVDEKISSINQSATTQIIAEPENMSSAAKLFRDKVNSIHEEHVSSSSTEFDIIPDDIESPSYIKSKIKAQIINLCKVRRHPGDIKRAVVDIAKLCSKATFYRYLSELKKSNQIYSIEVDNQVFLIAAKYLHSTN